MNEQEIEKEALKGTNIVIEKAHILLMTLSGKNPKDFQRRIEDLYLYLQRLDKSKTYKIEVNEVVKTVKEPNPCNAFVTETPLEFVPINHDQSK